MYLWHRKLTYRALTESRHQMDNPVVMWRHTEVTGGWAGQETEGTEVTRWDLVLRCLDWVDTQYETTDNCQAPPPWLEAGDSGLHQPRHRGQSRDCVLYWLLWGTHLICLFQISFTSLIWLKGMLMRCIGKQLQFIISFSLLFWTMCYRQVFHFADYKLLFRFHFGSYDQWKIFQVY